MEGGWRRVKIRTLIGRLKKWALRNLKNEKKNGEDEEGWRSMDGVEEERKMTIQVGICDA